MENKNECTDNTHKSRNNKFGVTWCVKCGRLFTKPAEKDLKKSDIIVYNHGE